MGAQQLVLSQPRASVGALRCPTGCPFVPIPPPASVTRHVVYFPDASAYHTGRKIRRPVFNISSWFWINSLTRSIGAAAVFETAAETPPIKKSITKGGTPMTDSFFGGSLLMMKTGDRLIKGLRGDVGWSGKEWYERMEVPM